MATATVRAQDFYLVYGRLKTESGRLENGKITLKKNGVKQRVLTVDGSGKFEFELDLNSDYIISFSQEGYVTKKISFSTHAPAERIQYGFDPFEFQVEIFKQYDEISTVVFNQPVGQIKYSPEIDDFDYDKDYSKSILREMEEVAEQTRQKEKEEETKSREKEIKPEKKAVAPPPEPAVAKSTPEAAPAPVKTPEVVKETVQPNTYTAVQVNRSGNLVVLQAYTVGEHAYPNLPAYGYINFGDGGGNREISREQFLEYAREYR